MQPRISPQGDEPHTTTPAGANEQRVDAPALIPGAARVPGMGVGGEELRVIPVREGSADWLRGRREALGLSLEDAAAMMGLEPHQLSGIEKGYRKLTHAQARRAGESLKAAGF